MIYGIVDLTLEIQDAKHTINHLSNTWIKRGLDEFAHNSIITKLNNKLSILEIMSNDYNFDTEKANQILMEIKLLIYDAVKIMELS